MELLNNFLSNMNINVLKNRLDSNNIFDSLLFYLKQNWDRLIEMPAKSEGGGKHPCGTTSLLYLSRDKGGRGQPCVPQSSCIRTEIRPWRWWESLRRRRRVKDTSQWQRKRESMQKSTACSYSLIILTECTSFTGYSWVWLSNTSKTLEFLHRVRKNRLDSNNIFDSLLFYLKQRTFHIISMISLQYVLEIG